MMGGAATGESWSGERPAELCIPLPLTPSRLSTRRGRPVRVDDDTPLVLNGNFTSKRYKVKVGSLVAKEAQEEQPEEQQVHKVVGEDRKIQIQAALVRLLKARREMEHNTLMAETIAQLAARFQPSVADIKEFIEVLIDKEYIARSATNPNIYIYVT
mmetsp:Transcript_32995/g.71261  ORF Transcript_32995/g.71261 Transcript_32995/m.71261 type:complete len:157 (-) Transcript_32995:11-481(-)